MKAFFLTLIAAIYPLAAESLNCVGVLGNSGEQGGALIRFGTKTASGMGVVHDANGALWDRGGAGRLNRYSADGRLLASHPLTGDGEPHAKDRIVLIGDVLLLKLGKNLHALRIDAPSGTAPTPLGVNADRISFNTRDGFAAASSGKTLFLIHPSGETQPVGEVEKDIDDIEIGSEGNIHISNGGSLYQVESNTLIGPKPSPGNSPQWLDGQWFGTAWHGTLRRFNTNYLPDPGVVLGGASGSFIGYVEGNHELNDGRGLAHLRGPLFAASGAECVLHLMEWQPETQRFVILRRIGAVPSCSALSIDSENRIWHHAGYWEWNDAPDTPLRHSISPPDAPGFFGAASLPNGVTVAPAIRWKNKMLFTSTKTGPARLSDDVALPDGAAACAISPLHGRHALWVSKANGEGTAFFVSNEGTHEGTAGSFKLETTVPLENLTTLSGGDGIFYAAANGHVIEFSLSEMIWRETKRWNSWDSDHFGNEIHLTFHEGRLWIADTTRHRVLCFDANTRKPLATFGRAGQSGDSLTHLNSPRTIAVRGRNAVVHDTENQRLLRMELFQE